MAEDEQPISRRQLRSGSGQTRALGASEDPELVNLYQRDYGLAPSPPSHGSPYLWKKV
jgi:hypothetical protein